MTAFKHRALASALIAGACTAQAALIDRGGGMVYDSTLNITWLQDWNLVATSGYGAANAGGTGSDRVQANGRVGWAAAKAWAAGLVHGGFDDWRLPFVRDTDAAGCDFSNQGGTDCGFNMLTKVGDTVYSELAHLYYVTLGNVASCNPLTSTVTVCDPQSGSGWVNQGPFVNFQTRDYWFGQEDLDPQSGDRLAWSFGRNGSQNSFSRTSAFYAVAVRDGDVAAAIPEPHSLALVAAALGAGWLVRRRRPR